MLQEFRAFLVLLERGELPLSARLEFARRVRRTMADAWASLIARRWSPLALPVVVLLATLVCSRGLRFGRHIMAGPINDLRVTHGIVLVFSVLVGLTVLWLGRRALSGHSTRYWSYFVAKTFLSSTAVVLTWVEWNGFLRDWAHQGGEWRVLVALPSALACVTVFALAIGWCLLDQRARCPVCLRRLSLPTSMGSWASVFEPPSTELWCEAGHGTLSVAGLSAEGRDHWTSLDASWRDLFRA